MAHDNMKKWLAAVADTPAAKNIKKRMLTEDADVLKNAHSDQLARPEQGKTASDIINRVAGGLRGVRKDEVEKRFNELSVANGFKDFAHELESAKGAHDEEMHVQENLVDEEEMEEGNEFSGARRDAIDNGKDSFEVDGHTYPVKEDENEIVAEEWNVLYDSVYGSNIRAHVRVNSNMKEEQVKEWFNRTFQPVAIHELKKNVELNNLSGDLKVNEDSADSLSAVSSKLKNGEIDQDDLAELMNKGDSLAQKLMDRFSDIADENNLDPDEDAETIKELLVADLTGAVNELVLPGSTGSAAIGPGANTVITAPGPVKPGQKRFGIDSKTGLPVQLVTMPAGVKEDLDRKRQGEEDTDDVKSALDAIHLHLSSVQKEKELTPNEVYGTKGNRLQRSTIKSVARQFDMSPKELMDAWTKHPDGIHLALKAANEQPILEDHNLEFEVKDDHEVSMAQADLYRLAKDAAVLHDLLDDKPALEGWVQAKITLAKDYIQTVRDYMEYETISGSDDFDEGHEDDMGEIEFELDDTTEDNDEDI